MNNLSMIKEKRGVEKERENYSFSFNLEKAIFRYFLRKRRVGEFLIVRSREFQKEGRSASLLLQLYRKLSICFDTMINAESQYNLN